MLVYNLGKTFTVGIMQSLKRDLHDCGQFHFTASMLALRKFGRDVSLKHSNPKLAWHLLLLRSTITLS